MVRKGEIKQIVISSDYYWITTDYYQSLLLKNVVSVVVIGHVFQLMMLSIFQNHCLKAKHNLENNTEVFNRIQRKEDERQA